MQALNRQLGVASPASIVPIPLQTETHDGRIDVLCAELAAARREIRALRRELAQTRERAQQDHLTQIGNRRLLDLALPGEMAKAAETGEPLCFALIDIDRFKALNDLLGHDAGDGALKSFARLLRANLKGRDTPIRFGGDEFALILPRTAVAAAEALLGQIRAAAAEVRVSAPGAPRLLEGLSISFGVAEFDGAEDMARLVRRADRRLYESKARATETRFAG